MSSEANRRMEEEVLGENMAEAILNDQDESNELEMATESLLTMDERTRSSSVSPSPMVDATQAADTPPPLPTVDYRKKIQQSALDWSSLEIGLEPEVDGEFVWLIKDWSKVCKEDKIKGPKIKIGDFTWQPLLIPNGSSENRQKTISFFIVCAPARTSDQSDWHVCARIILAMRNPSKPTVLLAKHSQHRFDPNENDWGFNTFCVNKAMKEGDVSTNGQPLLSNDSVEVVFKVQIIKDIIGNLWHNFINYNSKKATGCVGIQNQGATCYMNSLLQSLFMTNLLRKATYKIPTQEDSPTGSIALALQRTFYRLQTSEIPISTTELTKSFGWDSMDSFMQHDVHEFNRVLMDELESRMKNTEVDGMIQKIFTGKLQHIRRCLNVDFQSVREEDFYDVQLTVRGMKNLQSAFEAYIKPEMLTGDNKYHTDEFGYQDAKMFCAFASFPPVLHLHLERYTFDPYTGNTVKINDRFEFPTKINLDKYLVDKVDRTVPQNYVLHSVLVHGGDSHGGHYFAYIKLGEKWFKFDDTRVVQVSEKEAVIDNYGQDEELSAPPAYDTESFARPPSFNRRIRKMFNAYMLVYIREADFAKIMEPVTDVDIPLWISDGVKADEEAERRRKNEKYDNMMSLNITLFTGKHLMDYTGPDIYNLSNRAWPMSNYEEINSRKDQTVGALKEVISEKFGLDKETMRLWNFAPRRNNTNRLDSPLLDDTKPLGHYLTGNSRYSNHLCIFLELGSIQEVTNLHSMLTLKYFNRKDGTLSIIGVFPFHAESTLNDVFSVYRTILGISGDVQLEVYEEIKPIRLEIMAPSNTIAGCKLGTGDILVAQEAGISSSASVVDYYNDLTNRLMLTFRPYEESSRKRSVEDASEVSFEDFHTVVNMETMPWSDLLSLIAQNIEADPEYIKLYIQDPRTERCIPLKSVASSDLCLNKAIQDLSSINLPSQESLSHLTFAIEVLDMPLSELESMKTINLHFNGGDMEQSYKVYIPFDGFFNDLIEKTPLSKNFDGSQSYRLLEVAHHKIINYYDQDSLLTPLNDNAEVYLEPIPADQLSSEVKLISVYFYSRGDPTRTHSHPFIFNLLPAEEWSKTLERLRVKINNSSVIASLIVFGVARPINEATILYDQVSVLPGTNRVPFNEALGVEMNETSPAVSPTLKVAEKSIKIRSQTPINN